MIQPAGHRVLVKVEEAEKVTKGGILIPENVQDRNTEAASIGVVVAVGPTAWAAFDDGTPWAAVGDKVAFAQYGGKKITDPATEETFRVLNDEDIIAVFK
jgi:chaperonin GroES